jgi:hypothetical protein
VCCWWETSRQCRNVWVRRTRLLRDDEGVGHGSIRIVSVHGAVAVYDHAVDSAARFNGDGRCVLAGRMGITVGLTGTEDRVVVDAGGGYEGSGGEVALHATHGPVYVGPGAQVLADNPLAGWAGGTDGYVHITVGGGVSQFDNEGVVLPSPGVIFAGGELIPPLSGCLVPFAE